MPYPNEHSCRLEDPANFQGGYARFKRGQVWVLIAQPKSGGKKHAQALRYPTGGWTEEQAREHCKKAGGEFEPAEKK